MGRRENPIPDGALDLLPVGARMRLARHQAGVGLGALAVQLGYTKAHLSAVENGTTRPSRQLVLSYERALGLDPGTLLAAYERDATAAATAHHKLLPTTDPPSPSIDLALDAILTGFALSEAERALVRRIVIEKAHATAQAVRASADWWREPGPSRSAVCRSLAGSGGNGRDKRSWMRLIARRPKRCARGSGKSLLSYPLASQRRWRRRFIAHRSPSASRRSRQWSRGLRSVSGMPFSKPPRHSRPAIRRVAAGQSIRLPRLGHDRAGAVGGAIRCAPHEHRRGGQAQAAAALLRLGAVARHRSPPQRTSRRFAGRKAWRRSPDLSR
ncbi:MAG: hypothetical protein KatS3mg059_1449 [Thermomicrobiales bacterium]|nr:MAG: hypothetical protein KatS3mg059_1449 [Thermomicrobiales bacterium]